jgi:hypothetical protein
MLKAVAARNPFEKTIYQSHILSLNMYIDMLLQYKEHLSKLEAEIDALAKEIEEYNIIKSIPGIGEKIAATFISEIGEIDRFTNPKKLVAFAGVDPSVFESVSLELHKIVLPNEVLAGYDMLYIWQSVQLYGTSVKPEQMNYSFLETRD